MGKSYVENSLKRFLKRKVKITLGMVVTFLITGAVSFSAENVLKVEDGNLDKAESEKWLAGYNGTNHIPQISSGEITIGNGKIKFNEKEIDISKINLSNEVAENITTMAGLLDKNINKNNNSDIKISINEDALGYKTGFELENGEDIEINEGIIKNIQTKANQMVNKGIIDTQLQYAQYTYKGTAYNYGIINGGRYAQATALGTIYNYGIINANEMASQLVNNASATAYNYGVILNSSYKGQYAQHGGTIYNYGVIVSTNDGQHIEDGTGYNYGIISNTGNHGQEVTKGKAYNYGIISNGKNNGVFIHNEAKGYNYGIIANKGDYAIKKDGELGEAINYGVVKNQTGKVFSGKVDNYGIVILTEGATVKKDELGTGKNKGVILSEKDGKYTLNTKNGEIDLSKDGKVQEDNKIYYTQDKTAEISKNKLTGNTLTSVITGKGNNIAFSYNGTVGEKKDELILKDVHATGYFLNDGTLLNVTNSDLALINSKLNAVSENSSNVIAVNLNGGYLSLIGESEVYGKIAGKGGVSYVAHNNPNEEQKVEVTEDMILRNDNKGNYDLGKENKTDIVFSSLKANNLILNFAVKDSQNENKLTLNNATLNSINGSKSTEKIELTLDSTANIGDITLGQNNDTFNVTNSSHKGIIDMGAGQDEFNVSFGEVAPEHKKEMGNTFDYKVNNVEKIVLNGNGWHIGENAELNTGNTTKANEKTELHIADNSSLHVDMNNNYGNGNVTTSLDKMANGNNLAITTGKDAEVKFVVGDKFNVSNKQFDVAHDYSLENSNLGASIIFKGTGENGKVQEDKTGKITLVVKDATEYNGKLDNYKAVYDAMLNGLSKNEDLRDAVNYSDENKLVDMVTTAGNTAKALYTTGYAVTKDTSDTYISVVENFGRKAGQGEWIAYGKYVNSDTEFDGGKNSKGYDGDITGTVGMLEYGMTDSTSYGIVYGQGDTEVNINGGGKLDGDNTYFGGYVKHATQNGFDLIGNVGYTKNELDLNLVTTTNIYNMISSGNSDADALTFSLKAKKDYALTDTIKLQPVFGARYTLINQDAIESKEANFRADEQDVTIFEGMLGGNVVKDFNVLNGKLSLSVGAKYILADVSKSEDARYTLYGKDIELTDEEDIADNRVKGEIGAEYIHENGIGVDAKYEMIWTNKGDNSRITAGISYKF